MEDAEWLATLVQTLSPPLPADLPNRLCIDRRPAVAFAGRSRVGEGMIYHDTRVVRDTLCSLCMEGNKFFAGPTTKMRQPNGGNEVTGGSMSTTQTLCSLRHQEFGHRVASDPLPLGVAVPAESER